MVTWLKREIILSGQSGSAGSVHSGESSRVMEAGASLKEVLDAGDWSNAGTYKKYYFRLEPLVFSYRVLL